MNLLHLATPIQEEILNWSEVENEQTGQRAGITAADANPDVVEQLELWRGSRQLITRLTLEPVGRLTFLALKRATCRPSRGPGRG